MGGITLNDTVEMMNSKDYTERMKAEFLQLRIRRNKLQLMIDRYIAGELNFEPTCSLELLQSQVAAMDTYALILKERARLENVDLFKY